MSWHYTFDKVRIIAGDLAKAMIRETEPFGDIRYAILESDKKKAAAPHFDDSSWALLPENRAWGTTPEITAWLRTTLTVPAHGLAVLLIGK